MHRLLPIVMGLALAVVLDAHGAGAQQVDAHVSYLPGDASSHFPLVGGGLGVRLMFPVRSVVLGTRLGADYAREEHLGPGRGAVGVDLTLSPQVETSAILPYAGVGVSMNWSGGRQQSWDGVRSGLDGIVGMDLAMFGTNYLGLKVEERYGRIERLPATFATRLGLIVGF